MERGSEPRGPATLRLVPAMALAGGGRREQLLDALARLLALQVGEHPLRYELGLRASAIERELAGLEDHTEASR